MFSEADIRKECSEKAYQRGRQLFIGGNVQTIQVLDAYVNEHKYKKIKAYVQGSSWRCYHVDVTLDEKDGSIPSYKCECPAFQEYEGLCKHSVAAILRYMRVVTEQQKRVEAAQKRLAEPQEQPRQELILEEKPQAAEAQVFKTKEEKKQERKKIDRSQKTDVGLYRILMNNGLEQQLQYRQQHILGRVHVVPLFHERFGKASVEFKIGATHMYVLKNVMEFAELINSNERKRYGTKLEFYHHMSAFAEESLPLVRFLVQIAGDFENRGGITAYQYYTSNDVKREIPLVGSNLDNFMDVMEDREFEAEIDYDSPKIFHIEDGVLKLPLYINGVEGGIRIVTPSCHAITGASFQYIYQEKAIYRVSLEHIRKIRKFREYMNKQNGQSCFIAESDLTVFCRDMLQELEQHYDVRMKDFTPSTYLPDDVKFEIYLDMPQYDVITCKLTAVYGDDKYDVFSKELITQKRDAMKELEVSAAIGAYFPGFDEEQQVKTLEGNADEIYDFMTDGILRLYDFGEVYISDKLKRVQILKTPGFGVGISLKSNLLELQLDSKDMPLEELVEILTKYNRKKKYYRLKNGSFINMQDDEMSNLINLVDGLHLTAAELKASNIVVPKYRALYLDSLSREDGIEYFQKDKNFRELVRKMRTTEENDYQVPGSLQSIMREYQKNGFSWLKTLHANGFGGILADDMGLGKTLQVISFLKDEIEGETEGYSRKTLIVTPASLVYNWQSEIERFAPELQTIVVTGDMDTRKQLILESKQNDIIITSYDLLKRDIEFYEPMHFFCEIIDEAQFIKNQNTQAAKAVKMIQAGTKFALTGTPMENRLSELWSIFDYLMPGFLFHYKQFKEEIESPIVDRKEEGAMLQLRRFITPFILRRLKKDVLKDLPDKMEEVVYAKMEEEQQTLYEANVQKMRQSIGQKSDKEFRESKIQLLAELTKLRQICCNPSLVYDQYKGTSAKVDVCMELLHNAIEGGHKILLFSQFTSMLDLLVKAAEKEGISYYLLTGQTPKEQRMKMVEDFNQDETNVFFISLKAGGTGLNLTSADIVIHFDPWWNLAAQNQATDRTHRIGQKNVVTVYKLIAKDTIEEKIVKLQEMKQELADQVLSGENMDKSTFSKDDLMELLS